MTPLSDVEAEAIGRRWLAAGGVWREGMIDGLSRVRTHHATGRSAYIRYRDTNWEWVDEPVADNAWPDLRDAATRGAALDVVRERWGDHSMHLRPVAAGWGVFAMRDSLETDAPTALYLCIADPTEPEALVAALEARHEHA